MGVRCGSGVKLRRAATVPPSCYSLTSHGGRWACGWLLLGCTAVLVALGCDSRHRHQDWHVLQGRHFVWHLWPIETCNTMSCASLQDSVDMGSFTRQCTYTSAAAMLQALQAMSQVECCCGRASSSLCCTVPLGQCLFAHQMRHHGWQLDHTQSGFYSHCATHCVSDWLGAAMTRN